MPNIGETPAIAPGDTVLIEAPRRYSTITKTAIWIAAAAFAIASVTANIRGEIRNDHLQQKLDNISNEQLCRSRAAAESDHAVADVLIAIGNGLYLAGTDAEVFEAAEEIGRASEELKVAIQERDAAIERC